MVGSIPGQGNRMAKIRDLEGTDPMGRTERAEIKSEEQRSGHAELSGP